MKPIGFPDDRFPGCLPRVTRFASACPAARDHIPMIPESDWKELHRKLNDGRGMRSFVPEILDQDGAGCHDEKTQVLTSEGWQDWSSYDGKSELATINPVSHVMEFQKPSHIHAYEYDGLLYYCENRSTNFAVTPNHRMYLRKWNERERTLESSYGICDAENIGWYAGQMASPCGTSGLEINSVTIGGREVTGDDFIALIGLVCSDGWAGGTESTWSRVSYCCFNENRIQKVRELSVRLGFTEYEYRPGVFVKRDVPLADWIRSECYDSGKTGAVNKRIPAMIKSLSSRQISHFFDYFGDRHITDGGRRSFYSSSVKMVDDIQELLLRVGKRSGIYKCKMREVQYLDENRVIRQSVPGYQVGEWQCDNLSLEKNKLAKEHYKGMVYCATVPNSLLVTRRDNRVLISGNSCATESTTMAVMADRNFRGLPHVLLNPWFIYYHTGGQTDKGNGRGGGSSIDANLEFARENGIAPMSAWPREKGWRTKPSDEAYEAAKEFKIVEFYDIENFREAASVLLAGFSVVYGARGHSVLKIALDMDVNSWGTTWGDGGFGEWAKLKEINFEYGAFAVRVAG